jgi:cold shock CspA family protein
MEGTLRFWNAERGFGFIDPALGTRVGGSIFLHISGLADTDVQLMEGARLKFDTVHSKSIKHPLTAINVVVLTGGGK